jgi:hypothetical protein
MKTLGCLLELLAALALLAVAIGGNMIAEGWL